VTDVTDYFSRPFKNAGSCWEYPPERKANETHWHVTRRENRDLNLPPAPEKGRSSRVLSAADQPSTKTAASVEALDERRLGFSTRRPGQGRKDFECKPLSCSP